MRMNKTFGLYCFLFSAILVWLLYSCANIGSITGGDKDSIPPVMVSSYPLNRDTNFKDDKIQIRFNEYFDLKDINTEFMSSPPFVEKPDFKIKKKTLLIELNEPLKDSVTYTFKFGNAITDFNEGNIIKNYQFIFSTHSFIDTFSIAGNLRNAFDLIVPKDALVMIFDDHADSIPFKSIPSYLSKIDSSGNFSIDNIKSGKYKIFALEDLNTNMKADEFEARAFLDSLILPEIRVSQKIDSLKAGTIVHDTHDPSLMDSLLNDTVIISSVYTNIPSDLQLYLFKEDNLNQKILDVNRESRKRMGLVFQLPVKEGFSFKPINITLAEENLLIEKNRSLDTLVCWVTDTAVIGKDSLEVMVSFMKKDSSGQFVPATDTLFFTFREKQADDAWKRKQTAKKQVKEYIKLIYGTKENMVDINNHLLFEAPTPLNQIDTSKIKLFEIKDTLTFDTKEQKIEKTFRFEKDLLYFKLKRPLVKNFKMEGLNFRAENWYAVSVSDSNKVFTCRISDQTIAGMDTLKIKVHFDNYFFLEQTQQLTDTVILPISAQKILSRKRNTANRIDIVFDKPQKSGLTLIPDDFFPRNGWYSLQLNKNKDSLAVLINDKKVSDLDTLTFSIKSFDYIGLKNDSVLFNETMRIIYKEKPQFLSVISRVKDDELKLIFNKGLNKSPEFQPLSFTINNNWYTSTLSATGDTLTCKITDAFVSEIDTLGFIVNYTDINRKGGAKNFSDTVQFISKRKTELKAKTTENKSGIEKAKAETVHIYLPASFNILEDSINIRRRLLTSNWKSNTKYVIKTDSMAFTDVFGIYSKEESYEFATRSFDYYAKLILNLINVNPFDTAIVISDSINASNVEKSLVSKEEILKYIGDGPVIIQLLDSKGNVLKEFTINNDKKVPIEFLYPGKYMVKAIFDRNRNGKWDTGNYFLHLQPERVILSEKPIELKSNFETNINWDIKESLIKSFTSNEDNGIENQSLPPISGAEEE